MRKLSFTLFIFIFSFGVLFAQMNKNKTISSAFDDGKVPYGHIL